jgi:hypothetical protein
MCSKCGDLKCISCYNKNFEPKKRGPTPPIIPDEQEF